MDNPLKVKCPSCIFGKSKCCGRLKHAAAAIQRFWRRRAAALIAEDGRRLWNLQSWGRMVNKWHLRQKVERSCILPNQKRRIWGAARGTAEDGGQLWKELDIAVEALTADPIASAIPEDLATDLRDCLFDIFEEEEEAGEKWILVPEDGAGDVQEAGNPNRVKFPDCGRGQHNCSSPLCAGFSIDSDYDTGEVYNGQYCDMVRRSMLLAAKAQQHWVWLVARLQSAAYRLRPALRKRMASRLKVGDAGAEGNRWQRRSRLQGSARLVARLDAEVADGPEAPAMQVTLPAAPVSPLHEWEPAWSARRARLYWWNKNTRESRWDPPSTASREARSSSQK